MAPPVAPPPVGRSWPAPEYRNRTTMGDRFAGALPGTARRSLEAVGGLYSMFAASLDGLGSDLVRRKFQFNEFVERAWFLVSVSPSCHRLDPARRGHRAPGRRARRADRRHLVRRCRRRDRRAARSVADRHCAATGRRGRFGSLRRTRRTDDPQEIDADDRARAQPACATGGAADGGRRVGRRLPELRRRLRRASRAPTSSTSPRCTARAAASSARSPSSRRSPTSSPRRSRPRCSGSSR